jgi:hypothetical protein
LIHVGIEHQLIRSELSHFSFQSKRFFSATGPACGESGIDGTGQVLGQESAPEVAQCLLVSGLEKLSYNKLNNIAQALDGMAVLLGAQNLPPQLILSPEVNKPEKTMAGTIREEATRRRSAAK